MATGIKTISNVEGVKDLAATEKHAKIAMDKELSPNKKKKSYKYQEAFQMV